MTTNKYGNIHFTKITSPLGMTERIEYEWVGGNVIRINGDFLNELDYGKLRIGDVIKIGPYRLRCIELNPWSDFAEFMRADNPWSLFRIWFRTIHGFIEMIYHRIIITLAVWRLADYQQYKEPSWRDIRWRKHDNE